MRLSRRNKVLRLFVAMRPQANTTISLGRNEGTKTIRTYSWNTSRSVAPATTIQALAPSMRIEAILVVVHQ